MNRETREIVASACGDRSENTCRILWDRVPSAYKETIVFSDYWGVYRAVIPSEQQRLVGKETEETAHIERWNNTLRKQLARFLRETFSFSKCIKMHEIYLKLFIHRYNTELKEEKNVLVYTIGCLIIVRVFAANVFDWKAVRQLIMDLFSFLHTITKIWADSAYSGPELSDLALASNSDA